jgi:hypothetical protein
VVISIASGMIKLARSLDFGVSLKQQSVEVILGLREVLSRKSPRSASRTSLHQRSRFN